MKPQFSFSIVALACSAALITPTYAADVDESQAKEVERISVTGSRIKRLDLEGASPITIITADEIMNDGFKTVGDALRASNLNSFGSWGGGSNNGWGSQSTVALKGSSAFHTLVLLDGKRMAKSPVLNGGASNLNTIPLSAVERIEVLSDGASAIYGTDAIAGVINIILKKDFEGIQFDASATRPSSEGGDSNRLSFTGGLNSDMGQLVFTIEHYEVDTILQKDRSYTSPFLNGNDSPDAFQGWTNLSPTGRVLTQGAAGGWVWSHPFENTDKSCADVYGSDFVGVLNDTDYAGDTLCGYDYTQQAATSVSQTRDNTLINYTYDIFEDVKFTARAYWAKNKTLDVSAPVPASISIPQGLPAYTTDEGIQLRELTADPNAGMRFRFDTAGNRVSEHHDSILDYLIGLEGSTDNFDWDVSVNYNKYNNYTWGTGYLLRGASTDLVGSWDDDANDGAGGFVGWDPRDPNSPMPAGAAANYDKRMIAEYFNLNGGIAFSLFDLPGGEVQAYVGAAYREESIDSKVAALAEAGKIAGGNGGSGGSGDRDVTAGYFELALPVLDDLEINLAGRYDNYSDFGGTFNPQISARYQILDSLGIRTSWGTGFRAPTLSDLYQGTTEGYGDITNSLACLSNGEEIESCNRVENAPTRTGGNRDLKPETSTTFNLGVAWNATENIGITLDYWTLETEDLITTLGASEIVETQAKLCEVAAQLGTNCPGVDLIYPGTSVTLAGNGRIDHVVSEKINVGLSEREGIDFNFSADFETGIGDFGLDIAWTHYIKYRYTYSDGGVQVLADDIAGRDRRPDDRGNITLKYSRDEHSLTYYGNYIDKQKAWTRTDSGKWFEIDSVFYHNLTYSYELPWNNRVSVGVTNLSDEEPAFRANGEYEGDLYDIRGRAYWVSFSQSF